MWLYWIEVVYSLVSTQLCVIYCTVSDKKLVRSLRTRLVLVLILVGLYYLQWYSGGCTVVTVEHGSVTTTTDKEKAELLNSSNMQVSSAPATKRHQHAVHHILMNQYCAHQRLSMTYYWKFIYPRPLVQTVSPKEC